MFVLLMTADEFREHIYLGADWLAAICTDIALQK